MKVKRISGGALLLGAAAAWCTTSAATANCPSSTLVYDNGFPILVGVVASQVNDPGGLAPAGSDDFDVAAPGGINDVHWYTADDTNGIGWSGGVRVAIYQDLGGCTGPDKSSPVSVADYFNGVDDVKVNRTIVTPGWATLGATVLDLVRYDVTNITNISIPAAGTYWLSVSPISNGPAAPGQSFWVTSRAVTNGDVIVGCPAFANADDGGGWTQVNIGGDVDLNFQLTRCVVPGGNCPWDIASSGGPTPDGLVNVFDLLELLANWNTSGNGAAIAAPVNIVDVFDLLDLLANWNYGCAIDGSNDDCELASLIAGTGVFAYDGTGATQDGANDGCGAGPDVWFCWKAECTGLVTLTGDNGFISVYESGDDCSCPVDPPIACVDPFGFGSFNATEGQHYMIRVIAGSAGAFQISDCEQFNDDCVDAVVLFTTPGTNMFMGSLLPATAEPGGVPSCDPPRGPDTAANLGLTPGVWFITIGDGSTYTVSTCNNLVPGATSVNADMIAVYCGNSCDQLIDPCVNRSSNNICPSAPNARNTVEWCTVAGVIYVIYYAMDNDTDTPGDYTIKLVSNNTNCTAQQFELGCPGIPGDVCTVPTDDGLADDPNSGDTNPGDLGAGCQLSSLAGQGAGGTVATFSDENQGFIAADNFVLANGGQLSEICWYGIYVDLTGPFDCNPGVDTAFKVRIYNDTGGIPGGAPLYDDTGFVPVLNVDKIYTGLDQLAAGGIPFQVYEYTYAVQSGPNLAANTCYWLEINNNTQGNCIWGWLTADPGDGRSVTRPFANPSYTNVDENDFDLAWCLDLALGDIANVCPDAPDFVPVLCTLNGYFQNPQNFGTGVTSDLDNAGILTGSSFAVADNFIVDGAGQSITGVCWWGVYFAFAGGFTNCLNEPAASSPYRIRYLADDGNNQPDPNTVLGGPFNVVPSRQDTVVLDFNLAGGAQDIYEFSATHAAVPVSDGQIVWVEITHNGGAAETCVFLWIDAGAGIADAVAAQSADGGATYGPIANDMAFRVSVTGLAPTPPPPPPAPVNDACADAIDLSTALDAGVPVVVNNVSATPDDGSDDPDLPVGSPSCHWAGTPDGANHTVWYTVTMPAGQTTLRVEACTDEADPQNSLNDSTIAVFSGTCGSLVEIGCGEDDCPGAPPYYSDTGTIAGLTPGQTYYICVMNPGGAGNADAQGDILIRLTTP